MLAFVYFPNPPKFISRYHSLRPDISDRSIILSLRALFCFGKTNFIYFYIVLFIIIIYVATLDWTNEALFLTLITRTNHKNISAPTKQCLNHFCPPGTKEIIVDLLVKSEIMKLASDLYFVTKSSQF